MSILRPTESDLKNKMDNEVRNTVTVKVKLEL